MLSTIIIGACQKNASQETINEIREEYGLNKK